MITTSVLVVAVLAAFGLGYCSARCSEEERRCETWRDGVRFGATWREDLEDQPKAQGLGVIPRFTITETGEWVQVTPSHESYTVTADPDYREMSY